VAQTLHQKVGFIAWMRARASGFVLIEAP